MEWAPGAVRSEILQAHNVLRAALDDVERALGRVMAGDGSAEKDLTTRLQAFAQSFQEHLVREEAVLRPVLLEIDSFGAVRAERMDEEHRAQRVMLDELRVDLVTRGGRALQDRVRAFVAHIREDMEAEEAHSLREDLLKDDPITTGPTD